MLQEHIRVTENVYSQARHGSWRDSTSSSEVGEMVVWKRRLRGAPSRTATSAGLGAGKVTGRPDSIVRTSSIRPSLLHCTFTRVRKRSMGVRNLFLHTFNTIPADSKYTNAAHATYARLFRRPTESQRLSAKLMPRIPPPSTPEARYSAEGRPASVPNQLQNELCNCMMRTMTALGSSMVSSHWPLTDVVHGTGSASGPVIVTDIPVAMCVP